MSQFGHTEFSKHEIPSSSAHTIGISTPILRTLEDPIGQQIMPSRTSIPSTQPSTAFSSTSSSALTVVPSSSSSSSSSSGPNFLSSSSSSALLNPAYSSTTLTTTTHPSLPSQQHLMLPPPSRNPRKTAKEILNDNRLVLTEEAYNQTLDKIVERTYYPQLATLQAQLQWLEALETRDPVIIANTKARLASTTATDIPSNLPLPRPEWGGSSRLTTPSASSAAAAAYGSRRALFDTKETVSTGTVPHGRDERVRDDDDDNVSLVSWSAAIPNPRDRQPQKRSRTMMMEKKGYNEEEEEGDDEDRFSTFTTTTNAANDKDSATVHANAVIDNMSLTTFQNAFTTEDNKSFETNFQRQIDKKQKEHWWAHIPVTSQAKVLMLHDRSANRIVPENKTMAMLKDQYDTDTSSTPHHHVRNSLFFLPNLDQSNTISQVKYPKPNNDLPLLLTNKAQSIDDSIIVDIDSQVRRSSSFTNHNTDEDNDDSSSSTNHRSSSSASIVSHMENSSRYHGMDLIIPMMPYNGKKMKKNNGKVEATVIHYDRTRIPDTVPHTPHTNGPRSSSSNVPPAPNVNYKSGSNNDEYGYVSTPALVAGVNMTPIMTWGEVSGTPIILDPSLPTATERSVPTTVSSTPTVIVSSTAATMLDNSTMFATRAEDLAKQAGIDLLTPPSSLFASSSTSLPTHKTQHQRETAHQTLVQSISDARYRRAEKAGTLMSNPAVDSRLSSSSTPNIVLSTPSVVGTATVTPTTVALTKAHLRQAIAEAQLLKASANAKASTTPSFLGTHQTATPLFAASMTPSAWTYPQNSSSSSFGMPRSSGTSAESIVSSRSHHSSVVSQRSTASSTAASLLRSLPPTARKMATSIASNVAKDKGFDNLTGDLSGVFTNPHKRSR